MLLISILISILISSGPGIAEHTSFEVPTVSLHVHERIDPKAIIKAAKKGGGQIQTSIFELPGENPPMRTAVEFYKHPHGWSNRLVAGDSLLVMNSLLEKEELCRQRYDRMPLGQPMITALL